MLARGKEKSDGLPNLVIIFMLEIYLTLLKLLDIT